MMKANAKNPLPARIGIYSGTFDPVHAGHLTFALQAMTAGRLDRLYFLPERQSRSKPGAEHFAHRVAMLKRAARPHRRFGVIESVEINFSVERTLPKLFKQFSHSQLIFLVGSDVAAQLANWPKVDHLLHHCELIIATRGQDTIEQMQQLVAGWPAQPRALTVLEGYAADVSSDAVREGLRRRQTPRGLLTSVARYSNRNWLYVSLS